MRHVAHRSLVCLVVAGVALASAGATVGNAAWGQSEFEISPGDAELLPADVAAGADVTVRSVGHGCLRGSGETSGLVWAVFPRGDFEWGEHLGWEPSDAVASGAANPDQGVGRGGNFGSWSVTFPAPDLDEGPPGSGEIGPGSPVTSPVLQVYGPLPFTVDGEHELDFVAKCYTYPRGPGDMEISPEVPELGGSATVTALDPCPMPHTQGGSAAPQLWEATAVAPPTDSLELEITDLPRVDTADDGSWSTTFEVPDNPDHAYALAASCVNVEGGRTFGYWLLPFDVREPAGPRIETPRDFWSTVSPGRSDQPAQPLHAEPTFTG